MVCQRKEGLNINEGSIKTGIMLVRYIYSSWAWVLLQGEYSESNEHSFRIFRAPSGKTAYAFPEASAMSATIYFYLSITQPKNIF